MDVEILSKTNELEKSHNTKNYSGKAITETLTNGFFVVDRKWTVKYWNKAAEKLLAVKASKIIGKNLWQEFAAIIPLEFYSVYQKAFLQDIPVHFEEYWGEMGAWFDVITYYCDDTLSVSFKSSNHPHAEYPESPVQRLKTLTELYKFVTEITNDCLWEWNLKTSEIFWIDGGHKRVFGYPIENALLPESFWENRIHPEDKRTVLKGLRKVISAAGNFWEADYRFARADGSYAYVHDRAHVIYEKGKASRIIGATQDTTQKILLELKLKEEQQANQKEITNAVIMAQENERMEIGKELHDHLNQVLAVTKIYIELARKNGKKTAIYLEKSSGFITNVMEEIRKISKNLVPSTMELVGLSDSIQILLHDFMLAHPITIEFHQDGIHIDDLDEKLKLNIFRIIQEQLSNIIKHAEATHAGIKLSGHKNEMVLFISDNGQGCDTTKKVSGIGIRNVISRAELFNGTVTVVSSPGHGYSLSVVFPFNKN